VRFNTSGSFDAAKIQAGMKKLRRSNQTTLRTVAKLRPAKIEKVFIASSDYEQFIKKQGLPQGLQPCHERGISRTLSLMEVHSSPDVETRLQQLAVANGKDAEQLVKDTVARMLENQARFIAGVQRGIEQADRGEFVEHKDVLNRIERLFHP
jgi:predicted transcriptional regulator